MTLYSGAIKRPSPIPTGTDLLPFSDYPPAPNAELHVHSISAELILTNDLVPATLLLKIGGDVVSQVYLLPLPVKPGGVTQHTSRGQRQWTPPLLIPGSIHLLAFRFTIPSGSFSGTDSLMIQYVLAEEPAGTWDAKYNE